MAQGKYIHLSSASVEERRQQMIDQDKSLTIYLEDLQKTYILPKALYKNNIGMIGFVVAVIIFLCFLWYMNTGWRREVAEIKAYHEHIGKVVEVAYVNGEIIITTE